MKFHHFITAVREFLHRLRHPAAVILVLDDQGITQNIADTISGLSQVHIILYGIGQNLLHQAVLSLDAVFQPGKVHTFLL